MSTALRAAARAAARDLSRCSRWESTPLANALRSRSELDEPEPRYPLDSRSAATARSCRSPSRSTAGDLFDDYAYFSSYSTRCSQHADGARRRLIDEPSLGPDRPRRRDREQRRLPAAALRAPRRARARHRPGAERRRGRRGARHRDRVRLLRRRSPRSSRARADGRRAPRQQRAGPRARRERLRRGIAPCCWPTTASPSSRRRTSATSSSAASSTRSTTSTSSTTRSPRSIGCSRATACASSTSSDPDPRRLAAGLLRPAGCRRRRRRRSRLLDEEDRLGVATERVLRGFRRRVAVLARSSSSRCSAPEGAGSRIAAYGAAAKGTRAAERVRHRHRAHRLRRRPEPAQAGPLHARRAHPDRRPRAAARATCPTTCCCSPGTSPTRSSSSRQLPRGGGRFIVPVPEPRSSTHDRA